MATQKRVEEYLRAWQEASELQEAVKAAAATVRELNGLYEESATNLLARKPDLMLLISAYRAGQENPVSRSSEEASSASESKLPAESNGGSRLL